MRKSTEHLTNMLANPRPTHTPQIGIPVKKSSTFFTLCQLLLMAVLMASLKTVAQEAPQAREIRVGDRAPLFTLKDQNDCEVSLETMLKKGPVAVVFVRSVEWCSYCQLQTIQLSRNLEKIKEAGGQVVVICYDAPEKVK